MSLNYLTRMYYFLDGKCFTRFNQVLEGQEGTLNFSYRFLLFGFSWHSKLKFWTLSNFRTHRWVCIFNSMNKKGFRKVCLSKNSNSLVCCCFNFGGIYVSWTIQFKYDYTLLPFMLNVDLTLYYLWFSNVINNDSYLFFV